MSFSEWREVKLEDIIEIEMGQSPKSEFYNQTGEGLPFLQGNRTFGDKYPYFDTYCTENKKIANKNDVIMSVRAPVGDLNIAQTQISLGRGVCAMRLKGEQNSNYLFYLMKHNIKEMINRESGTVFGSVNKKDILGLDVKITNNKLEQKAIAHILSTLDDKIEVNNQINKTLENMAQAIFKQWFVDFEFPNEDGEPYKSSGGEMVESELGMIPKGWEVMDLSEISTNIITGKTPSTKVKENYGNEIPFVKIPDMHGNVYITKTESYLSKKGVHKNKIIPRNAIIVSCIATPGLVSIASEDCQTNQQINSLLLKDEKMCYFAYFKLIELADYIRTLGSTGSATLNLNKNEFSKIKIVVPEKRLIEKYYQSVKFSFEMILENMKSNEVLRNLRDTLLPKLMSGEIRVPLKEEGEVS